MYRLSRRQIPLIWVVIGLLSIGIVIGVCFLFEICDLLLSLSILSATLGFVGTVIIALPSLVTDFSKSEKTEDAAQFVQYKESGYYNIRQGKSLNRPSSTKQEGMEFAAMASLLQGDQRFEGPTSTISMEDPDGESPRNLIVDGEVIGRRPTIDFQENLETNLEIIEGYEEQEEEEQERLFVLLGCGIYGQAIIFQALSTIIPSLNSSIL